MEGIIQGAAAAGARLVYGDNLYGYGPVDGPLTEDLPDRATGPNGRVRAQLAQTLLAAHRAGTVEATIGRASDFFGPQVRVSAMGERVFPAVLSGRPAQVLPDPDTPHTYTFVDDAAAALVTLGNRDPALGQVWHVPSAETPTTRRFVELVFEQAGQPPRLRVAPRLAFGAAPTPHPEAIRQTLAWYRTTT
jgi:nucleoside-diphosphate-sugar epimerase